MRFFVYSLVFPVIARPIYEPFHGLEDFGVRPQHGLKPNHEAEHANGHVRGLSETGNIIDLKFSAIKKPHVVILDEHLEVEEVICRANSLQVLVSNPSIVDDWVEDVIIIGGPMWACEESVDQREGETAAMPLYRTIVSVLPSPSKANAFVIETTRLASFLDCFHSLELDFVQHPADPKISRRLYDWSTDKSDSWNLVSFNYNSASDKESEALTLFSDTVTSRDRSATCSLTVKCTSCFSVFTAGVRLQLSASAGFESWVPKAKLKSLSLEVFGQLRARAVVEVHLKGKIDYETPKKALLQMSYPSITFSILGIPVNMKLSAGLDAYATVEGEVEGKASAGLEVKKYMSFGFQYQGGELSMIEPGEKHSLTPFPVTTSFGGHVEVRGFLVPWLEPTLYQVLTFVASSYPMSVCS